MLTTSKTKILKNITKSFTKFQKFNYKDALNYRSLLTEEELEIEEVANNFFQTELQPSITLANRNKHFDKNIYKKLGEMGFLGSTLKEYGGSGISSNGYGLINKEIERVDSSYRSALSVQSSLVIHPLYEFGLKGIKDEYLPGLMSGELIGAFGLTEPNVGSDPSNMSTNCLKQKDGGYILNGSKNWITNSPIADVFIIWAKDKDNGKLRGFFVDRKKSEGIHTPRIEGKLSLVASETGMIMLEDVYVPKENVLQVEGFKGPFSCLNNARFGISWGVLGAAEFCFHFARHYTLDRTQFDSKLAGFQLIQKKFADMETEISLGLLGCIQLGKIIRKFKR